MDPEQARRRRGVGNVAVYTARFVLLGCATTAAWGLWQMTADGLHGEPQVVEYRQGSSDPAYITDQETASADFFRGLSLLTYSTVGGLAMGLAEAAAVSYRSAESAPNLDLQVVSEQST